jgi:hypothetical protein
VRAPEPDRRLQQSVHRRDQCRRTKLIRRRSSLAKLGWVSAEIMSVEELEWGLEKWRLAR